MTALDPELRDRAAQAAYNALRLAKTPLEAFRAVVDAVAAVLEPEPANAAQCRSCGRPVTPCPAYPGYRFMCLPVIRKPDTDERKEAS